MMAIVAASFVSSSDSAWAAAATPGGFTVDCTDATTLTDSTPILDSSLQPLVNRVVSGDQNDTFVITNSGSGTCTVTIVDATVLTGPSATTNGSTVTLGVAGSGSESATFIIQTASGGYTITSTGGSAVVFGIDTDDCSLAGAGIESAPFLVGEAADFQLIGEGSCGLAAHYLQTDDLDSGGSGNLVNYALDHVNGTFTGTYDGDHYRIGLAGTWVAGTRSTGASFGNIVALFPTVVDGTIKRVRIGGNIHSSSTTVVGGLVGSFSATSAGSAVISEVRSSVAIFASGDGVVVGGMVGKMGDTATKEHGLIQYSAVTGPIEWVTPNATDKTSGATLGGMIGSVEGTGTQEIRDSYSQVAITFTSASLNVSGANNPRIYAGGLVGAEDTGTGVNVNLVRSYSVSPITDECVGGACVTLDSSIPTRYSGGLVGRVRDATYTDWVSNFYESGGLASSNAVGVQTGIGQPSKYDGSGNPVAVPLSASRMKQIATYTTFEGNDGSPTDLPGGSAMPADATTDYRWAIEEISAYTFVPSSYDVSGSGADEGSESEISDFENRVVYASNSGPSGTRFYRTLRGGDLSANNVEGRADIDPVSVENYPTIGRVWDICDDYPTLVWENVNSCGGGGGSGGGSSSPSTADLALAAGLTEAEYAAYLASGLTLEQFLAARLAATGPNGALLVGGGSLTLLFLAAGAAILVALRRECRLGRL
jgi:hypothetical protein